MKEKILRLVNVSKDYFGVHALKNVSFDVIKGEIHGLIGENGAGKSTLIKSIAGAIEVTDGSIYFDENELILNSPLEAIKKGIGVVYQEFNLFPNLSVYENVFFGIELKSRGILDRKQMIKNTKKLINDIGFDFDVTKKVRYISTAHQQITEIIKCINHKVKLIIMDEPSTTLTNKEVYDMFKVVRKLNENGVTVIYVSHKLEEILSLTDRVSILRDGNYIATVVTKGSTEKELIKYMVGRDLIDIFPEKGNAKDEIVFRCNNLTGGKVKNVSFDLKKGEVLGFAGLVGAGRTELMRLIFGADKKASGAVKINGNEIKISNPNNAIENGLGLVPEDRKHHGLILNKSIFFNTLLPSLKKYSTNAFNIVDFKSSQRDIGIFSNKLNIKCVGQYQIVQSLSGGNQQKVVLSKWLLRDCEILILDEPTRGVDVGAKSEIYNLIKELSDEGKSIIVVSSEMPELIGVSHRVIVMREGEISGELVGYQISQESIMELAS